MIRNAVGTVITRMIVTAATNRTIGRLATRMSTTTCPKITINAIAAIVSSSNNGTTVNTIFPGNVSRFHDRPITVMRRSPSLVDAAHDGVEGRHDCHRVSDEVPRHHDTDGMQVDERRVVDAHAERLVGAVADHVRGVLAARPLDACVRPPGSRPKQARQLGYDRSVGHLVEALVDDPQALLDLVHAQQVAREAVPLRPG